MYRRPGGYLSACPPGRVKHAKLDKFVEHPAEQRVRPFGRHPLGRVRPLLFGWAERGAEQAGIGEGEPDIGQSERAQPLHRPPGGVWHRGNRIQALPHGRFQCIECAPPDHGQQLVVISEVPVGRGCGNAGCPGGGAQHDSVGPSGTRHVGRRVGQGIRQVAVVVTGPAKTTVPPAAAIG